MTENQSSAGCDTVDNKTAGGAEKAWSAVLFLRLKSGMQKVGNAKKQLRSTFLRAILKIYQFKNI